MVIEFMFIMLSLIMACVVSVVVSSDDPDWKEPTCNPGDWALAFNKIPGADKHKYWSFDNDRVYGSRYTLALLRLLIRPNRLPNFYYDVSIPIDVRLGALLWRCASHDCPPPVCIDAANIVFYNKDVLSCDIKSYFDDRALRYAHLFKAKKNRDTQEIQHAIKMWLYTLDN